MEFSFRCSCCVSGMSTRWLALACFRGLSSPLARIDSTWARTSKSILAWRFKSEYMVSCYFGAFHRGGEGTRGCHGATLRGAQWRQNATKRRQELEEAPERASGSQDGPNVTEDLVSSPSSCVAPTSLCP